MTTDTKSDLQVPANWIDDEAQPGVQYIKPNIEINLSDKKRQECREIVKEIKNFGINQRQLLFLIDLLALEVENLDLARDIRDVVRTHREKLPESTKDIPGSSGGIIIPK